MTSATHRPSLADEIDAAFGDPRDESNPLGHRSVLDADERQELLEEGERRLDAVGLSAAFVPRAEGGGLTRLDRLAATLRTVWRRDPCLGQGYGLSSLVADVDICSAGDDEQRVRAAALLLGRSKIACCGQEPTYDEDLYATGFDAVRRPGGWLLSDGRHSAVNVRHAKALVVFAVTDPARADCGHSQFLIEKSSLPAGALRYTERGPSAGMRGTQLGGDLFTDCLIPAELARRDKVAPTSVLDRLARRLHPPSVPTEAKHREVRERLWHDLLRRGNRRQLLDLTARQVPG
jgi:alkylation response protein AidB-like acyl-CoA dehydrogenase